MTRRRLLFVCAVPLAVFATAGIALAASLSVTSVTLTTYVAPSSAGCSAPGTQTVTPDADTFVVQDSPTANFGSVTPLDVKANTAKNRRTLLHFALPALPSGCSVTLATLSLRVQTFKGGLVYQVYRVASSWTESGATWNNQPATAGTPATATTANPVTVWDVSVQVQALYAASNTGLLVKDSVEDTGATNTNRYHSRESANPPELVITFG